MMKQLAGGTAIVTGGSRGIGPYIARALAQEGMRIVLAARTTDALERVAAELRAGGTDVTPMRCDVTVAADRDALIAQALDSYGRLDVLVNNAGLEAVSRLHEMEPAQLDSLIDVNLRGAMQLTRAALPHLLAARRGHIVNLASISGLIASPYLSAYSATKFGLVGFTRSLRHELRGTGVGASAICPGFVSDVGMYVDVLSEVAPSSRSTGTVSPERVAQSVVLAVRRDLPEIVLSARGARLLHATDALFPRFADRVLAWLGVTETLRTVADAHPTARP